MNAPASQGAAWPQTRLPAGTWTGEATFTQSWAGTTETVRHLLNLVVGDDGIPRALPALGVVAPWGVYVASNRALDLSPGETLERGGSVWAFCRAEKAASANEIVVRPLGHFGDVDRAEWRYQASYRFADLIHYQRHDYVGPTAVPVTVEARDAYQLEGAGSAEALRMSGRAMGKAVTGEALVLELEVVLTRGHSVLVDQCRLGPP
jgi:hypothetical protein